MPTKTQKIALRKPRTDAQHNRDRILEEAKQAFTRSGANASLDDIAKEAEHQRELAQDNVSTFCVRLSESDVCTGSI
jgi:AcrR family transcriptional regulator